MIEGAVHGIDPNWLTAILAAASAGVGAGAWYRRGSTNRRRRQTEYRQLWEDYYGTPELRDEQGVIYQRAERGTQQELTELRGAFYGHVHHPPHPGRRESDQ